jgi:hypothetical protein
MITADDAGGKLATCITGRIQISRPDPQLPVESGTFIETCPERLGINDPMH